ncbi:hypothetical protein [Streptomyces yunnanensis]|uniref:Uncharacterized protein n=1 Tax=Streptomyces yunnanensis TaxID=156453 RepID=A0A9X8QSC9_9ACTN|nr:hypothetical protein [Streptomyces yunnanensis]SHL75626.1 hypothetical protein SAMN05216268_10688 [Streptomyces yunnanensis]
MYEIPKRRAVRRAVTRDQVAEAEAQAALIETLIDAIDNEPEVRAAILRVVAGGQMSRRPRPTTTQPVRRGRGR